MNRTLPPLKLSKSPLAFVIGQLRFETILTLDQKIPDIQETFRKAGFTGFQQKVVQYQTNSPLPSRGPQIQQMSRWEFQSADKTRAITLDRNSVSCQTTAYTTYEEFEKDLLMAIGVVGQVAEPKEAHRIGLRYVDVIAPAKELAFDHYVASQLLGLSLKNFGTRLGRSADQFIETGPNRRLKVRYVEAARGMALPADVVPLALKPRFPIRREEPFAVLDSDHFDGTVNRFTVDQTIERIAGLHDILDQVFREIVTKDALKEWA